MIPSRLLSVFWVVWLLPCWGCGQAKSPKQAAPELPLLRKSDPTPTIRANESTEVFALDMQTAVRAGFPASVEPFVDYDALMDRALMGLEVPNRRQFSDGFKNLATKRTLMAWISDEVQKGGSFTFLHTHTADGEQRALFRVISKLGLNYLDVVLTVPPDGHIRITDIISMGSGEAMSQTMHRTILALGGALKNGVPPPTDYQANVAKIDRFRAYAKAGRDREALKAWARLPISVANEKLILLLRIRSAARLAGENPGEYKAAIADFRATFPKDAGLDLITIDAHWLDKRFIEYRDALDRIDSAVGGDPYLEVLRAHSYLEEGAVGDAKAAASRAIMREPDLADAYWMLARTSARSGEYQETVRVLDVIEQRFGIGAGELDDEDYDEFTKSAAYKKWLTQSQSRSAR